MYSPLMHEFMKCKKMLNMFIISMFSKSGQEITPLIYSRNNIWKTRNNREIKRRKPSSQDGFHMKIWLLKTMESPLDSLTMDSPSEWYAVWMCLVFVHHQRSDLIIVVILGKDISLLRSLTTAPEDVGPKVCTSMLKGRARPPQVYNDLFLISWFCW